jgi:hypothetical protein
VILACLEIVVQSGICRTIVDPEDRDLPPAAVIALRHDGTPDVLAILRSVIRQPNQIPALMRTAIDAWTAREALLRGRHVLGAGLGCPYFDERACEPPRVDAFATTQLRSAGS